MKILLFIIFFFHISALGIANKIESKIIRNDFYYNHWEGGREIDKKRLKSIIVNVLRKLDFIEYDEKIVDLVFETSRVETLQGRYIKQISGGPAKGIYQIEIETAKDHLKWLQYFPDRLRKIMSFYHPELSLKDNLKYNLEFQTSMCLIHYFRFSQNNLIAKVQTIKLRAIF